MSTPEPSERLTDFITDLRSVLAELGHLRRYVKWLEEDNQRLRGQAIERTEPVPTPPEKVF